MNKNENDKRRPKKKESFLKENGLLVGLYSVVGALVVTAGVLTVKNLDGAKDYTNTIGVENYAKNETAESLAVSTNDSKSYQDQGNTDIGIAVNSNVANVIENSKTSTVTIEETPQAEDSIAKESVNEEKNTTEPELKPIDLDNESKDSSNYEDSGNSNLEDGNFSEIADADTRTVIEELVPTSTNALFRAFSDDNVMDWPMQGEVLMTYSDKLIYDQTLDQYKTNDTVRISANLGDNVLASFDGEVIETGNSYNDGNYIVLSHGNGWTSTYSQLDEHFLVTKGDVVTKGQVIGAVSEPTRRYNSLYSHLGFKVAKNNDTVDPTSILAKSN